LTVCRRRANSNRFFYAIDSQATAINLQLSIIPQYSCNFACPSQARFASLVKEHVGWKCNTLSAAKHRQLVSESFLNWVRRPLEELMCFNFSFT